MSTLKRHSLFLDTEVMARLHELLPSRKVSMHIRRKVEELLEEMEKEEHGG